MGGILEFALKLNNSGFKGPAKEADEIIERVTKNAKGTALGEMAENFEKAFSGIKSGASQLASGTGPLGLAGAFGSALVAVGAIKEAMRGVGEIVEGIVDKMAEAMNHGAELYYQSKRTDTSIGQLYGLREGAKAVGLSEEAPEAMMLRLQRALSGVSDEGQRTEGTFAALNLNMHELRRLNPEEQLLHVADALEKVNIPLRAGLASNIFGRYSSGEILQLVNQLDDFKREMQHADPGGGLMQETGQAFASAAAEWRGLKADMEIFFTGIGKYLVEPFHEVVAMIRSLPWAKIGEAIGMAVKPIAELLRYWSEILELATNPKEFFERKTADFQAAVNDAKAQPADKQNEALWSNMASLAGKWLLGMPFESYGTRHAGAEHPDDMMPLNYSPSHVNPFEKMGFVFGGGMDLATDYARRTAVATEKIANHLEQMKNENPGELAGAFGMIAGLGLANAM